MNLLRETLDIIKIGNKKENKFIEPILKYINNVNLPGIPV